MSKETESRQNDLPKLVRDKVPARIKRDGLVPVTHIAVTDDEYVRALRAKLSEEVGELIRAEKKPDFIDELADVFEVLDALMDQAGVDTRYVKEKKQTKQATNGKFLRRIILDRIE